MLTKKKTEALCPVIIIPIGSHHITIFPKCVIISSIKMRDYAVPKTQRGLNKYKYIHRYIIFERMKIKIK